MDAQEVLGRLVSWAFFSLLIILALSGMIRLLAAFFSPQVRRSIRRHPLAHAIWLGVVLFAFWFIAAVIAFNKSERPRYMISQKRMLEGAAGELAQYGHVTTKWSNQDQFWLSSNVVTVGGTQYQCYAAVNGGLFGHEGTLAITTNKVFIWLSSNGPPKIIGETYRPSLFRF